MIRNLLGSLLALAGAAAAVWSPFRAWYGGRHGSDVRVDDLFTAVGVTPDGAALLGSLFLPLGFTALLAVLGVLLRSRFVVGLAGLVVLAVTVLWMVRQAQAAGSLTAGGDGLGLGVASALAAAALLLLAAATMAGRRPRRARRRLDEPAPAAPAPDGYRRYEEQPAYEPYQGVPAYEKGPPCDQGQNQGQGQNWSYDQGQGPAYEEGPPTLVQPVQPPPPGYPPDRISPPGG